MIRFSELFTKTIREAPADETAINAQLLTRGGFIHKVMSGVYEYLPLGYKVLKKINSIIREEMDAIGAQEIFMSVFQNKETWGQTGRWDSAKDVMYQFQDESGKDLGLGWTHEEPLTAAAKHHINSYKDLPKKVYQIQTKFRDEPRAKSGLLRGKEFLMKDLYSFHADENDLNDYYEQVARAYKTIFERIGIKARTTKAAGGLFSKYSDEFQVLSEAGEDTVFYCETCEFTANKEVAEDLKLSKICSECKGALAQGRGIEVGNIFKLGTRFSEAFQLLYTDQQGDKKPVVMASYGIGPGRLMGTIVETSHDDRGIIWPRTVTPFDIHLIALPGMERETKSVIKDLEKQHPEIEILLDDREDKTAGEKFADADLIGCPIRLVISHKTNEQDSIEIKFRSKKDIEMTQRSKLWSYLKPYVSGGEQA